MTCNYFNKDILNSNDYINNLNNNYKYIDKIDNNINTKEYNYNINIDEINNTEIDDIIKEQLDKKSIDILYKELVIIKLLSKYSLQRSSSQPIGQWSSGCIFKNPSSKLAASSLIDSADLSKERVGGIYVSRKHCNYLINDGTGTCHDLEELISFIRDKIKTKYNIFLDREICIY